MPGDGRLEEPESHGLIDYLQVLGMIFEKCLLAVWCHSSLGMIACLPLRRIFEPITWQYTCIGSHSMIVDKVM